MQCNGKLIKVMKKTDIIVQREVVRDYISKLQRLYNSLHKKLVWGGVTLRQKKAL